jgi:hypothetical protein
VSDDGPDYIRVSRKVLGARAKAYVRGGKARWRPAGSPGQRQIGGQAPQERDPCGGAQFPRRVGRARPRGQPEHELQGRGRGDWQEAMRRANRAAAIRHARAVHLTDEGTGNNTYMRNQWFRGRPETRSER